LNSSKKRLRQQFLRLKVSNYAKVSNFGEEGVSSYTLQQRQKRLRQRFSRLNVSDYAEVSNFEERGIRLHTCAAAKTLTSAIFKSKDIKLR